MADLSTYINIKANRASFSGNVTASETLIISNLSPFNGTALTVNGNLLPGVGNTYQLGNFDVPWQDALFGPNSITIIDSSNSANAANSVTIKNSSGNISMGTAAFTIGALGNNTPVFTIAALTGQIFSNAVTIIQNNTNAANITSGSLQTAGGAGIAKDLYVGGNISVTGTSNLGSNANVKITGGTSGQALTTDGSGNLSWTGVVNSNTVPTYGQFWSNATQTVAVANTAYNFTFNNTDGHNNVQLGTGASNSRVIINQTGLYNIQFSAQIDKAGSGSQSTAYIWFKKNGTAIADSAGFFTLDNTIQAVQSWNILANVTTAGDYYEIAYAGSTTTFDFPTLPGNATVGYPASPSIIVTVTPIGA